MLKIGRKEYPVFYGFQVDPYDFHQIWRHDYLSFLLCPSYTGKQLMQYVWGESSYSG